MLQTQVNYWAYMENKRHNEATEAQARSELAELSRHNIKQESLGFMNAVESMRHNRETEDISKRSNQIGYFNALEQVRSHKANEAISWANTGISRLQANTAATKVYYDNINTQYANRTQRTNAYTNQYNAVVRKQELNLKREQYNREWIEMPFKMMGDIVGGAKTYGQIKGK